MPGEPTETLLGTGAIGIGLVVAYAAYKNVSPLTLLRDTITKGKFPDISKLPKLFGHLTAPQTQGGSVFTHPADDVAAIAKKDKTLADRLSAAMDAFSKAQTPATELALKRLISQARSQGFKTEADDLDSWIKVTKGEIGGGVNVTPNTLPAVSI